MMDVTRTNDGELTDKMSAHQPIGNDNELSDASRHLSQLLTYTAQSRCTEHDS